MTVIHSIISKTEKMEDNAKLIESLLERATDYGRSSYELAKLKILDKTTDVVSSLLSHSVVLVLVFSFVLFLSVGLAIWLGNIFGQTFLGFFAVAGFYVFSATIIHLFFSKWLKTSFSNYFIKQALK
jgi:hypothetical protein